MPIDEVREIITKFNQEEAFIDQQLIESKLNSQINKNHSEVEYESTIKMNYEKAKERNKELLKELEATKGRLRSEAIFSPTEIQWEQICTKYLENPSLPVTQWRCHSSVFV